MSPAPTVCAPAAEAPNKTANAATVAAPPRMGCSRRIYKSLSSSNVELRRRRIAAWLRLKRALSCLQRRVGVCVHLAHPRGLASHAHHDLQLLELDTGQLRGLDDKCFFLQLAFLTPVLFAA